MIVSLFFLVLFSPFIITLPLNDPTSYDSHQKVSNSSSSTDSILMMMSVVFGESPSKESL